LSAVAASDGSSPSSPLRKSANTCFPQHAYSPSRRILYGACDFLPAFQTFIQHNLSSQAPQPNDHDRYNVYQGKPVYNGVYTQLRSRPHSDLKRQKTICATQRASTAMATGKLHRLLDLIPHSLSKMLIFIATLAD
jgi:hypothetical protein